MLDINELVDALASSDGDSFLAAERLSKKHGKKIGEYEITEILTSTPEASKALSDKLRTALVLKMFYLINELQKTLITSIDEIPPKDLARTLSSFMTAFATMTAPQAKSMFDADEEIRKAAELFGVEPEVIRAELNELKLSAKK